MPKGSVSTTWVPVASVDPLLRTVTVQVTRLPSRTGSGVWLLVTARSTSEQEPVT
jgi:hypothetical protein